MEKNRKIYNEKFKDIYYVLKDQGKIKGKTNLADILGTYNHIINDILKNKRSVTLSQMSLLIKEFNINANYLFNKSPIMFLTKLNKAGNPYDILNTLSDEK